MPLPDALIPALREQRIAVSGRLLASDLAAGGDDRARPRGAPVPD